MQKVQEIQSLGQEDPLEEEMATSLGILAWEIPWTEEPGGLQSIGLWLDTNYQLSNSNKCRVKSDRGLSLGSWHLG